MRQSLYILLIFLFSSCNTNNHHKPVVDTPDTIVNQQAISIPDSLDIDTTDNFITTNFTRSIQEILNSTVDSLGAMVAVYYTNDTAKDDLRIYPIVKNKLLAANFVQADSSYFLKRQFNAREYVQIEHRKNKKVLFYYGMDLWNDGKKYRSVKMVLKDYQALQ
ncbi:hypothetical protein [Ferruginibacter profundus]